MKQQGAPKFVAGEGVHFVDSVRTHALDDACSKKYCQDNCVEALLVATSGTYDGWLKEQARKTLTGFVARGWLNPYFQSCDQFEPAG